MSATFEAIEDVLFRSPEHRLARSNYPVVTVVQTRAADTDASGRLSNAAIVSFYENAQLELFDRIFGPRARRMGPRLATASIHVSYLHEARYPGTLEVGCGLVSVDHSGFVIGQALFQEGLCIGAAEAVVGYAEANGLGPISEDRRRAMLELRLLGSEDAQT